MRVFGSVWDEDVMIGGGSMAEPMAGPAGRLEWLGLQEEPIPLGRNNKMWQKYQLRVPTRNTLNISKTEPLNEIFYGTFFVHVVELKKTI